MLTVCLVAVLSTECQHLIWSIYFGTCFSLFSAVA